MSITTLETTDLQIQQRVQDEFGWAPDVDGASIGVAVVDGTVTLAGEVDDYSERRAAVRAAQRTRGVTTVVDDLVVHATSYLWAITETDVAKRVADAISSYTVLPDTVRADLQDHTVTLTGEVRWNFQREDARRAVEQIKGVASVLNRITLTPRASAADTDLQIREAVIRSAVLDAEAIHVSVSGTTVTLTGHIRSFAERVQAEDAAWSSPHVTDVRDYMTVTG